MKRTVLTLSWISILTLVVMGSTMVFIDSQAKKSRAEADNHIRLLSKACSQQVDSRFSASGNSNVEDVYTYNPPRDVFSAKHAAQLQCAQLYPLGY